MTGEQGAQIVLFGIMILLPLSSLIVRRPGFGATTRMALAWIAIFGVVILIASQRHRIAALASSVFADLTVTGGETRIQMGDDGHFHADVLINGVSRRMLVDSGATTTALSTATAVAAGIDLDESPFPTVIDTANGEVMARVATAKAMTIGAIRIEDLGVVVSPAFGDTDVIGMNLLSQLRSWRVEDRTLILTPKH